MAKVRRSVALTVMILTAVSLQWVTGLKVVEAGRSLNLTTHDNELIHTNEVPHWNETQEDTFKNYEDNLDQFPDKPNKFDFDVTQFTHTDDKNLHRIESERLANSSSLEQKNRTKNSADCANGSKMSCIQDNFEHFIDKISKLDEYNVTDLVQIVKSDNVTNGEDVSGEKKGLSLVEKVHRFARNHVLKIRVPTDLISSRKSRMFFGCKYYQRKVYLYWSHYHRCFPLASLPLCCGIIYFQMRSYANIYFKILQYLVISKVSLVILLSICHSRFERKWVFFICIVSTNI